MSKNKVSIDKSKEDQGQAEGGGVMSPKKWHHYWFNCNLSIWYNVSNNTNHELVIIRAPIDTPKPYSKPSAATSSSLSYTPRTASTFALYLSGVLPSDLK